MENINLDKCFWCQYISMSSWTSKLLFSFRHKFPLFSIGNKLFPFSLGQLPAHFYNFSCPLLALRAHIWYSLIWILHLRRTSEKIWSIRVFFLLTHLLHKNLKIPILTCLCVCIYLNPPLRTGCDTRSFLTGVQVFWIRVFSLQDQLPYQG